MRPDHELQEDVEMAALDFSKASGCPVEVGEPVRVFHQGAKRGLLGLRVIIVAAILVVAGNFFAMALSDDSLHLDGSSLLLIAVLAGGVIFAVVAAASKTMSFAREWRDIVVVGSLGLAYRHGNQWQVVQWSDITEVTAVEERAWSLTGSGGSEIFDLLMMFLRGHRYHYSIATASSGQIEIGATLSGADQLMDMVRQQTFCGLQRQALVDFEAGRNLDFGPVTISKHRGLSYGGRFYPWSNIRSITADVGDERYLLIKPKKGRFMESMKVREHDVPNLDLLLCIASQMMGCTWEMGTRTLESEAMLPPVDIAICPACGASNAADEPSCSLCGSQLHSTIDEAT